MMMALIVLLAKWSCQVFVAPPKSANCRVGGEVCPSGKDREAFGVTTSASRRTSISTKFG